MNRIGKKTAFIALSGMMIFSLSACGKKDNAADKKCQEVGYGRLKIIHNTSKRFI